MSQPYPPPPTWAAPPPKPFNWRRWAIWTTAAAAAAFGIFGAIGAATDDDASPEACKAALQRAYDQASAGGPGLKDKPPACTGVDNATMQRYIGEIMQKELGEKLGDVWDGMATMQP